MSLVQHNKTEQEASPLDNINNIIQQPKLLVIDDEPFNLEILTDYLADAGFYCECYENPLEGWRHLDSNSDYQCILLDRMMPDMDGLELLAKIKQDPRFQNIPVIIQTADGSADSLCNGMRAGAFYYLTKPFSRDLLLTVVEAALADYKRYLVLQDHLAQSTESLKLIKNAVFEIKTLTQADSMAAMLANCCHDPQKVVVGLSELLINAIEHGNLEIDFDQKTELLSTNTWHEYVLEKLKSEPFSNRAVKIELNKLDDKGVIEFIITDEGSGFDWMSLEDHASKRVMQSHGRGILIAKNLSFDSVDFIGSGNQVRACVKYI